MVSDRQLEGKATGDPSAARGAPYNATREAGPGSQRKQLSTPAAPRIQQGLASPLHLVARNNASCWIAATSRAGLHGALAECGGEPS